jgi:hypothetical protein
MTKLSACGDLPRWNGTVDSGWPVIIETVSSATTNAFRVPALFLNGCLGLDVIPALFLYKAEILGMWLVLAAGMYVLGRTLFKNRLSAAFLFVAVLFASMGLDDLDSDQDAVILFWLPWILTSAVQAHRNRSNFRGALYFNATILFLCLQAFDHYPHFPLVNASVGAGLYVLLFPRAAWEFVRRQILWLWPAAIPLLITGAQMLIFKNAITGYIPSQRGDLIIDLSQNGESGWVQPTVLLTSFLPLGTLGGFDSLANNMQQWLQAHGINGHNLFIFRPNSLIYYMGFIPTVFCAAFALRPGMWRVRLWWLGFTAIIFAISIQETQLSFWMFDHLPYFNVFRTYSLFGLFPVFGVLIMGGYGLDAFLSLGAAGRHQLVRRGLAVVGVGSVLGGVYIFALLRWATVPPDVTAQILQGLACDLLIGLIGGLGLWFASRSATPRIWAAGLIGVMIVSQVGYAEVVYHFLGIPLNEVLSNYGLQAGDGVKLAPDIAADPNAFERKQCDLFGECYLSQLDSVSLRRDDQGTFLRSGNEPVFQDGLATEVVRALDGITHPVFWVTSALKPVSSRQELTNDLNSHTQDIVQHLDQVTYVPTAEFTPDLQARSAASGDARLVTLSRARDVIHLSYTSTTPAFLNAAITHDPAWTATINGTRAEVLDSNFNGLLVPLPPGGGDIVLRYASPAADFFFYSRYALAILGVGVAIAIVVRLWARAKPELEVLDANQQDAGLAAG